MGTKLASGRFLSYLRVYVTFIAYASGHPYEISWCSSVRNLVYDFVFNEIICSLWE